MKHYWLFNILNNVTIILITKIMTITAPINAKPAHKGQVTHHQLQSIVFVNFNTKNIKNSNIEVLIPLFVAPFLLIFYPYD